MRLIQGRSLNPKPFGLLHYCFQGTTSKIFLRHQKALIPAEHEMPKNMSYSLSSLRGTYTGDYVGEYYRRGDKGT